MKTNFEKDNQTGINHEGANANWPVKYLTATSLIGDDVENSAGEQMGTIFDIMLNLKTGAIEYVVVEFGGFLGIGTKLFAVPFSELKLRQDRRVFILERDKEYLSKAPGFDKHHWPETNAHLNEVDSYWGSFMGNNVGGY